MSYARCNYDGSPLHPGDWQVLDTLALWLGMDEQEQRDVIRLDPDWQRFLLGETLAERKART